MIVLVGFSEKVFLWGPGEVLGARLASSKGRANTLLPGCWGGGGVPGIRMGPAQSHSVTQKL